MTSYVARCAFGASRASFRVSSETWMVAECECIVLASFVAQVRGVMFYGLQVHGARLAERVVLVRRSDNLYDNNCLEVRVVRSSLSFLLCHLAAEVAEHLSLLLSDAFKGSYVQEVCHFMTSRSRQ